MNNQIDKRKKTISTVFLLVGFLALVGSLLVNILGFSDQYHRTSQVLLVLGGVLIFFVAFLNHKAIIEFFRKKQTLYGLNSVLMALLFLAALGLLNYLGQKHSKEFDLTEDKINNLTEQSEKVVQTLKSKVLLTVILKKEHQMPAKDLLEKYRKVSPKFFTYKFLDEKSDPVAVQTFMKSKSKTAKYGMASLMIHPGEVDKMREIFLDTATEESITNGIIKLTQSNKPKVYFLQGHGEKNIGSSGSGGIDMVVESLTSSGNEVKMFTIAGSSKIPEDASVIVVAAPRSGYLPEEISVIRSYLRAGGRGIFLLDPDLFGKTDRVLNTLLTEFGVDIPNALVLDPRAVVPGNENWAAPLISSYAPLHPITKEATSHSYFPVSQVIQKGSPPRGLQVDWLFQGTSDSWGESDIASLRAADGGKPKFNEGKDVKGPVKLAVAVSGIFPDDDEVEKNEKDHKEDDGHGHSVESSNQDSPNKEMKLVVVGNGQFIGNGFSNLFNHDLFINMVNWTTGQEDLISIRPKKERKVVFEASKASLASISLFNWAVFPLFFFGTSIFVYFRRRKL
jgi:ABC-type uncharacterized transport system involved in gliding motility auxiliary subunit